MNPEDTQAQYCISDRGRPAPGPSDGHDLQTSHTCYSAQETCRSRRLGPAAQTEQAHPQRSACLGTVVAANASVLAAPYGKRACCTPDASRHSRPTTFCPSPSPSRCSASDTLGISRESSLGSSLGSARWRPTISPSFVQSDTAGTYSTDRVHKLDVASHELHQRDVVHAKEPRN